MANLSNMKFFKFPRGWLFVILTLYFSGIAFLAGFWSAIHYSCSFANRVFARQLAECDPPVIEIHKLIAFLAVQERRCDESFTIIATVAILPLLLFLVIALLRRFSVVQGSNGDPR